MKKERLGKGIASIFAENYIEETVKDNGVETIKISLIEPKSDQPRKYFDEESLEQLADSIKQHGLLQPIIVRRIGGGFFQGDYIYGRGLFSSCADFCGNRNYVCVSVEE